MRMEQSHSQALHQNICGHKFALLRCLMVAHRPIMRHCHRIRETRRTWKNRDRHYSNNPHDQRNVDGTSYWPGDQVGE